MPMFRPHPRLMKSESLGGGGGGGHLGISIFRNSLDIFTVQSRLRSIDTAHPTSSHPSVVYLGPTFFMH